MLFEVLTGRTVPVATRVVDRRRVAAVVADLQVASEHCGATALDRAGPRAARSSARSCPAALHQRRARCHRPARAAHRPARRGRRDHPQNHFAQLRQRARPPTMVARQHQLHARLERPAAPARLRVPRARVFGSWWVDLRARASMPSLQRDPCHALPRSKSRRCGLAAVDLSQAATDQASQLSQTATPRAGLADRAGYLEVPSLGNASTS